VTFAVAGLMVGGIAVGVLTRSNGVTVVMEPVSGERGAPGHGIVFYSGTNEAGVAEADQYSDWEYVDNNRPLGINYSDWTKGDCSPDVAATHPSDRNLHVLVGYSIGRLGPIYFLLDSSRWDEVDTIWLLDPGTKAEMDPPDGCDAKLGRRPGELLAEWLAGASNRKLIVVSAASTNPGGRAGLLEYYLQDIMNMPPEVANRARLCIDGSTGHKAVPGVYMPLIHGTTDCPAPANGAGSGPLAGTPTPAPAPPVVPAPPTPQAPPVQPTPPAATPPFAVPPAASSPGPTPAVPPAAPSAPPVAPAPAPSPQPTSAPAPTPIPRFIETTGGETHTWTNYRNAGGQPGPVFPARTDVEIGCKLQGFAVANSNTWWYRIGAGPYYASADAFYNNGAKSGPLKGTPYFDPAVPDC
jgi:hypothetical protein